MKLYDGVKIMVGIAIFLVLIAFPFWSGKEKDFAITDLSINTPKIEKMKEKRCVEERIFMRTNHKDVLLSWRDNAARNSSRQYIAKNGTVVEISLTRTCLKCHSNKEEFCDRCHNFVGEKPACWSCHITPQNKKG